MSTLGDKKNHGRVSIIIIGLTDQLKSGTVKMSSEKLGKETVGTLCSTVKYGLVGNDSSWLSGFMRRGTDCLHSK